MMLGRAIRELAESADWGAPKENLRKEMNKAGVNPSYSKPTLFHIGPDLYVVFHLEAWQ